MTEGERIKTRRQSLGLNQRAFAALCRVDRRSVWRWENGHRHVPLWVDLVLDTIEKQPEERRSQIGWLLENT